VDDAEKERRFRELFERHYGAIAAYADRRCPPADADDVVAETFAVAWRRLDSVPVDGALPWLYSVARKALANQRRSRRRWLGLLERMRSQQPDAVPEPGAGTPVADALRRLKADEREVLLLAAWEGLSHREIGLALGASENAIGIRVHRARKRLAQELAGGGIRVRKDVPADGQFRL
jgi:RNA polymerase sigma-70 factor (ECF subfamily)